MPAEPKQEEPVLPLRVLVVVEFDTPLVAEEAGASANDTPYLRRLLSALGRIPFEAQSVHTDNVCTHPPAIKRTVDGGRWAVVRGDDGLRR